MSFILLQSLSNYIEAHILLGRLEEAGIHCWLKDENLVSTMPLWANAAGGIKLMVAEDQVEQAQALLLQFDEEKRKSFTCPNCGSGNIEYISSNREAANWLSVILGFLFFSYALPVKTWRCFECKAEFKEPKDQYTTELQ